MVSFSPSITYSSIFYVSISAKSMTAALGRILSARSRITYSYVTSGEIFFVKFAVFIYEPPVFARRISLIPTDNLSLAPIL